MVRARVKRLSKTMSRDQFDRGYWYATELTRFATELGIPHATRLRKNELEHAIEAFLKFGRRVHFTGRPPSKPGTRDVERGLTMRRRVVVYTNDRRPSSSSSVRRGRSRRISSGGPARGIG